MNNAGIYFRLLGISAGILRPSGEFNQNRGGLVAFHTRSGIVGVVQWNCRIEIGGESSWKYSPVPAPSGRRRVGFGRSPPAPWGRVIDNNVSTDVGSTINQHRDLGWNLIGRSATTNHVRTSVSAIALKLSHAPIAVQDVVLNKPPAMKNATMVNAVESRMPITRGFH